MHLFFHPSGPNARKQDHDLSALVEGGLATLAIGRYLQRLRETELRDGIFLAASDAVRETALMLSAAVRKPAEILSVLEDLSAMLCTVMEAPHEDYSSYVHAVLPANRDAHHSAGLLFVERKRSQCHI